MAAKSSFEELKREANRKSSGKSTFQELKEKATQKRYSEDIKNVDESYIKSFFDDASSYMSDSQKELEGMDWKSYNSYYSRDKRYGKTQDLGYRAGLINYYLENSKDRLDTDTYSTLSKALSDYQGGFSQLDDAYDQYGKYFSQWGSDDEYQTAVRYDGYNKKYTGKSYQDLNKVYDTLEDGEEKDWLQAYKSGVYKDEMLKFDHEKAAKNVESLESILNTYGTAARYYDMYQANPEAYAGSEYDFIRQWVSVYEDYQKNFGSQKDLENYIHDTKLNINNSKRIQNAAELASVADTKSANYDPDFAKYSAYTGNTEMPLLPDYKDVVYHLVNKNTDYIESKAVGEAWNKITGLESDRLTAIEYMTPEEVALYNYYYNKHGYEAAEEYLESIVENLNYLHGKEIFSSVEGKPVLEMFYGAGAGLDQATTGLVNLFSDKDYIPYSATQYASGMVREDLAGTGLKLPDWMGGASLGQGAYDAITTTANMAPSILTSVAVGLINPALGTAAGNLMMGASATGNAYQEALNLGYDKGQARTYSTLIGASEVGLQYLLGGIGKLGGKISGKAAASLASKFDNAYIRLAVKYGANMISEGSEEYLQEILTPLFKNLALKTDEEIELITEDAIYSFLLGALSSGVMEVSGISSDTGKGLVGNLIDMSSKNQANIDAVNMYSGSTSELIKEGLASDPNSESHQFAEIMKRKTDKGKTMTGYEIRQQVEANEAQFAVEDFDNAKTTAKERLVELGETKNIDKIAKLVAKRATGQELTRAEISTLAHSQFGAQVAKEMTTTTETKSGEKPFNANYTIKRTYKPLEERVGTEARFNVAESGEATVRSTGEKVDLENFEVTKLEDGQMTIKAEGGEEVYAGDIDFANEDQAYAFSAVADIENITPAAATAMVKSVDYSKPVGAQLNGLDEAYTYGYYGYSEADLKAGDFTGNLTSEQMMSAYKLGQSARKIGIQAQGDQMVKMRTAKEATVSKKEKVQQQKTRFASDDAEVYFMDGSTVTKFDEAGHQYDETRMAGVNTAKFLSKLGIGKKYYFYESYVNAEGKRVYKDANGNEVAAPNGLYKAADGSIYIDLNAGNDGQGTTLFTLGHELGHFIKQWSPQKFQVLADFLVEEYGKTDMTMRERVLEKQSQLEQIRGEKVSYDEAFEEVVADAMSTMFADGKLHEKLAKLRAKDKSLFNKIKQFIDNLVAKFRDLYANLTPDQKDAQDVREMKDAFDRIQTAFAEALVEASDNLQAAGEQKNTTEVGGDVHQSKRLSENDLESYLKAGTRRNKNKQEALDRGQKIILTTETEIVNFINDSIERKTDAITVAYGKVNDRLADAVRQESKGKIVIDDNYLELISENLQHAYEQHSTAKETGDIDLSHEDFERIPEYLDSFTEVLYAIKYSNGPVRICVSKKLENGRILIIETVSKSRGAVQFKNAIGVSEEKYNQEYLPMYKKRAETPARGNDSSNNSLRDGIDSKKIILSENEKVKSEATVEMDVEVDAKTESVAPAILKSERTWTESEYVQQREQAAQEIAKAIGVSEQKAKDYIDSINSIAKMIAEDRSRLDYFSSPGRTSFVGNVEYGGSFDFSTLCKKRRLLTGTFTAIQKALPNTALTADEILDIRNRMKEAKFEVSCGLCYVEGSRANMGQFAKEFLRLYKQYYPDAWQPNMADVNTPDGIEWVRINHPECYEQYEYFWNHYGTLKEGDKNLFASQQKPKLYQLHTEYKGEILQKFKDDDNVEEKNLNGGIRLQSFSDFEIVHLIDTMQIIMDMSRVGLAGQAYTKVPDFAWALGDTGLKINLSLIAKGVDANGKLIFDDVEGMPIADAMKLRERYSKNVGTILVAFNDEQLLAAMSDERVDFIIPFHRSQWKKSQYEAMGLPAKTKDYTFMQNEKYIKPQFHEYRGRMVKDKATNYMPNEYWDFSKSGKENAEAYLEMCARNNKRPKFYKLLTNNGDGSYSLKADGSTDGYWKLLIDFKMYDNDGNGSPQMAVKPDFNMEEAYRMLETYKGGHSNFPVAQGIVDDFVKDYKKSHKGMKFSDRDSAGKQLGEDQLEYFEDSMARDRNGNLQVVYHGGTVEYEFDTTRGGNGATQYGPGSYFTDSEYYAKQYTWARGGDVKAYYLNINKMFDDTDMGATSQMPQWSKLEEILRKNGIEEKFIKRFADDGFAYMSRYLAIKAGAKTSGSWEGSEKLNAMLREAGFDGIKGYINDVSQYVIFTPNQAKLTSNEVPSAFYDTRYSERTDDSVSNRSLLANAFEWVVQNSEEYKLIQEYKGQVKMLNKLEEQLSDTNAEIRELTFGTEGARDMNKLQELREKADRLAHDINRHDKRLLSLEASEPLRRVIEQERKKAAQKTKAHVAEIQQNKKLRAEQTELRHKIRKTIRDLDKILNRGNKKLNVKEDMKGFVSKALELADYIFTDHISNDELIRRGIDPDLIRGEKEARLVKETEEIIAKLDAATDINNQDGSMTDEEFTRLDAKRKANEEQLRDLLKAQRNKRLNTPVYQLFDDLVTEYASLKNSNQDAVKAAYNEELEKSLRAFMGDDARVNILKNMRVADMTTEELNWLLRAYTMVLTNVRKANEFFVKGMNETIEQKVARISQDFGSRKIPDKKFAIALQKVANKIGWDYEKLYYALDRIGSEAFTELIMNIADSENTVMRDIMEAAEFRDKIVEKYGFNNWDVNKEIDREFLDNTGKKFKLTLGQMMSLYAYSRRKGAWDHIEYGGFVFGKAALTNPKPADSYKLNKAQCEAITSLLTKEQKGYVEEMQKFLSETMGEKGNEVSMLLYGIKMFGEKNYFPIHVAGAFMAKAQESQAQAAAGFKSMSNAGFTHAQNPSAKAPFVLEAFNDVWSDHVNEMSRYHGTVPALEDLRRVMNRSTYSDSGSNSVSIKQQMINSYGEAAAKYFDNLYREANSGAITDKLQATQKKLLSLFRKNSVAYSLSVLVQQPSSIVRAYALIDRKYFGVKGMGVITSGVVKAVTSKFNSAYNNAYNEMLKYAPGVTMAKEIGGFDTATGGSIRSYLMDTGKSLKQKLKTGTALEKGKAVLDVVDDNAIANLPNVADKIAWIEIWNACKREAVARNKNLQPGSEEFMQAVGERFTEAIRATQVYDSIFAKSPMLKSKTIGVQMLVSFMNEPNTVANMAEKAVRDVLKGDWKQGTRAIHVLIHSIVFTNLLKSLIYAMRDDDEDETYIEKYIEAVVGNLMSDFNALNYIPIARDVMSLAQGYDVERADMAIFADTIDAIEKVVKYARTDTEDMTEEQLIELDKKQTEAEWKLAESLAAFIGIPVKNIRREVNGVLDHMRIAKTNAGQTTKMSISDKAYSAVAESIPFMGGGKTKQDKLYDAIISGDKEYAGRIKSTYKTDDAYHTAVRKALRENDSRIKEAAQAQINGDPSERVRIAKQIIADGFDLDDVITAINSEISEMTDSGDTGAKKVKGFYKVEDFVREAANGDMASLNAIREDIIQTAQANGKTKDEAEEDFASDVKSDTKEMYLAGSLSDSVAKKLLTQYVGMDEAEADDTVNYWSFCKAHPGVDLNQSQVEKYQEFAEPANIPLNVFEQYVNGTAGLKTIRDEWGDEVKSKREQVLEVIDSLPLTWQQKDALYLAAEYAESKIWDVPW